jgi:predicted nucleotidyltransferase
MTPVIQKTVDKLVSQIVELAHPLRIVLFGSAARGNMKPYSDIDLLIVVPEGTDTKVATRLLYAGVDVMDRDYDLIVATPGVLEKYKDNCALVYKWALKEGKEVYAA